MSFLEPRETPTRGLRDTHATTGPRYDALHPWGAGRAPGPRNPLDSMWIRLENTDSDGNPVTTHLSVPGHADEVSFEDGPVQQVQADLGRALVESCPAVVEHSSDSDSADDEPDGGEEQ